jgi:hypothetical protein
VYARVFAKQHARAREAHRSFRAPRSRAFVDRKRRSDSTPRASIVVFIGEGNKRKLLLVN